MKKIVLFIFIIVLIFGGLSVWFYYDKLEPEKQGNTHNNVTLVKTDTIQSLVTAQGTLEPKDYVDIGAQVSGKILKMHVDIGDSVKNGDLIAEIDPDVYEANVRADKARLNQLDAQIAQQKALIKQAEWKFERNKKLYAAKAISKETFEDAEINLEVEQANLLSLNAQLEQSQSEMEADETNLGYTKIYSSMDGTVIDQAVEEGETINANQTTPTIVTVANLDVMTAKAEVAEADVMKLQNNTDAYFTTLGSGERRWEGNVRQILPTPEEINDVVLYNVLVDVDNKDHSLLPGMTTQMFFVLAKAENVPVIPMSALGKPLKDQNTDKGDAYEVRVMGAQGPEVRTVIVGLSDRSQAAVISGVKAGESVLPAQDTSNAEETRRRFRLGL